MSFCICPRCDIKTYDSLFQLYANDPEWNLLSLQDMFNSGNSLEDIFKVVPFRKRVCNRTHRCCGMCTRKCYNRCAQDCLNRLYMWRKLVATTPEDQRSKLPLNIRMIASQKFETPEDLSWCVSEILSTNTNTSLKEYMVNNNLRLESNPYKIDYAPVKRIDSITGKTVVDETTGLVQYYSWPQSGLCPYCLPKTTIHKGVLKRAGRRNEGNT